MTAPTLPSLIGATASGKTAVAVEVAKGVDLEVLSADSRQVYRRLDVGTAKPSPAERAAVPHHLLDIVDPDQSYSAARFGEDARRIADEVRERGRVPLLVGGSGLYLRAAETGLFEGPVADPELRARWEREADATGEEALHRRLAAVDPETAARLHPADRVRVIRALEVHELTGIPLSKHHRRHREEPLPFRPLRFGIEWSSEALARRIERRVDRMLEAGWLEEVERLLEEGVAPTAPALSALGYPEVLALARGEIGRGEARQRIDTATRRFAKRQRTWFRAVADVTWFRVGEERELAEIPSKIAEVLRKAGEEG